ncbi:DELTA-sagatoxin-Srs1a-like [Micropterus dolomieu]|uniref:DELTA-sagatoxin-Srs1a-like n=1 Tax=Micropterus dolomieu TaxID=147949 RepID=UPI001E8E5C7E|nr:DELTA-sagatoxin-Srs1a-like [Micropterus dolomieu]XP_045897289.1 DELTA-sagatoxin-Srs1a-like [Micropterus dolomieu]
MANRQCTFEIDNKCSEFTFCNPQVFTYSGIYEKPLSPTLGPSESGSALFIKTSNTACGAVGVFTYDLQNKSTEKCDGKMAVMYSVPYDYNFYSNMYAVGVFDVDTKCDYDLYKEMYYGAGSMFVRGKAKDSLTYKGKDVTIRATMSDSKTSVIKVQVSN